MLNEFVYTFNKMKQRYEEKERFIWFKFRDNIIYILCYYNIYIYIYVITKNKDILIILILTLR